MKKKTKIVQVLYRTPVAFTIVCWILNAVWKPCYLSRHLLNFWTVLHRRRRDGLAIRERREKTLLHYITLVSWSNTMACIGASFEIINKTFGRCTTNQPSTKDEPWFAGIWTPDSSGSFLGSVLELACPRLWWFQPVDRRHCPRGISAGRESVQPLRTRPTTHLKQHLIPS